MSSFLRFLKSLTPVSKAIVSGQGNSMMGLIQKLRLLLEGFLIPLFLYVSFYYIELFTINYWFALILCLFFGVFLFLSGIGPPIPYTQQPDRTPIGVLLGLFGVVIVIWIIPALFFQFFLETGAMDDALKIISLIIATGFGVTFYWINSKSELMTFFNVTAYVLGLALSMGTILRFLWDYI